MTQGWPPPRGQLHYWRSVGDPPADALVSEIFDDRGHDGVRELMQAIVDAEWVSHGEFGGRVEAFLDTVRVRIEDFDAGAHDRLVEAGQDVFAEHGPEIILILGCYSLPAAYAAFKGAKVLLQTGFLTKQPNRRLIETAQIIVDVMQSGGLHPGGIGRRSAEKTRIMHAAIRHLIIHRPDHEWQTEDWGVPINQEDLAATLMTFSYIVVDGLERMGVRLTESEKQSYLDTWREVGAIMGVLPELTPGTFEEARQLTEAIQADQVLEAPPSDHGWAGGRDLTAALLPILDAKMLPGVPASLMRLFLPREVCDGLGIPRRVVRDWVVKRVLRFFGWLDSVVLGRFFKRSRALRGISMRLLDHVLQWERGGDREPFRFPEDLDWYAQSAERSVGQRLVERLGRA